MIVLEKSREGRLKVGTKKEGAHLHTGGEGVREH